MIGAGGIPQVFPRDDNIYDLVNGDTVSGPFPTIAFALRVASGHLPTAAPATKFRRPKMIREVRRAASA